MRTQPVFTRSASETRALVVVFFALLFQAVVPSDARAQQEGPEAQDETQEPAPVPLPVIRGIEVRGAQRYTDEQMISALGVEVGDRVDQRVIDRGVEVLWDAFKVRADVRFRPLGQTVADGVDILLVVEELPLDLEPRFVGNVEIDNDELLEWAGIDADRELYLYQANYVRDRILLNYKREGFHFAAVNVVERTGGTDPVTGAYVAPDVIFEIKEGPEVKVRDVQLHGNTISNSNIWFFRRGISKLAGFEMKKPRLFGIFKTDFVRETLDADIIALRQVYRDLGYLDAVVEVEDLDFNEERDRVTIHVAIDEGEPYTVGSIGFEFVDQELDPENPNRVLFRPKEPSRPVGELLELLELEVGGVYESRFLDADERALREHYGEFGYIDHRSIALPDRWRFLDPELVFEEDNPVVHVTYRIAEGKQIFIREILVRGNLHTQDRVVRRLVTVEPGQVANPKEIARSRSRIQGTGFFSDQRDIAHREPDYRFLDTGDPNWKDLEYTVEEGQVLTFNISGGLSSNLGAFGIVALNQNNFDITNLPSSLFGLVDDVASREAFHGAGQQLRIQASPGTERSFFDVFFREPDLFRRHQDRISLSLNGRRRLRNFESHDEDRTTAGFELGRQLSPDSSVYVGFNSGRVDVDDLDEGGEPVLGAPLTVPQDLKDQEGTSDLAYVEFGYRKRTLDNRFNPRNGISIVFDNKVYTEAIGSDFDFVKSDLRIDWYDEFDEDPYQVSDRYHVSLWGGVTYPFGDTDEAPYTERFFLGGQRTLRGFEFRRVGPNENGFSVGGQTYLYGTLEYRRPLVTTTQPGTYREIETMQGGLFLDVGVLGEDEFSIDFDEYRASAGILFGISVPLPITFSFGWPLREGDGDRDRVLGFNIGF